MYAFGNLNIVAECDLGHLGPKQGQPIPYYWSPLYNLMGVLIWIPLVLAFVLKENRKPAALWILLPAAGFLVVYHILAELTGMPGSIRAMFAAAIYCIVISFCLVWLLAMRIGGRHRIVTALLALLIFIGMTALSLPLMEMGEPLAILAIFMGISFAVFTIAFTISAILCRKRMTGLRFALAMLPGCLFGTFIPFSAFLVIQLMQNSSYPGMVPEFLLQTLVASGCYYAVLLPFVILFFVSGFWRQRFDAVILRKKIPAPQAAEQPQQ